MSICYLTNSSKNLLVRIISILQTPKISWLVLFSTTRASPWAGLEKMFISLEPHFQKLCFPIEPRDKLQIYQQFPSENTSFPWNQVPKFHIFSTPAHGLNARLRFLEGAYVCVDSSRLMFRLTTDMMHKEVPFLSHHIETQDSMPKSVNSVRRLADTSTAFRRPAKY